MLKVLERAMRAKSYAERKLIRLREHNRRMRVKEGRAARSQLERLAREEMKKSRREEKEDLMYGPLAPRRALSQEEFDQLDTVAGERARGLPVRASLRVRYWNIVAGDRVVVLAGPDRHKIGVVKAIDKPTNTLTVEGLNIAPVKIPDAVYEMDTKQQRIYHQELPISYHDVRLVHPLPDPETGIPRDTIIANVEMSKIWYSKQDRSASWRRLVPGMNGVVIPWPKREKPEYVDHPGDTKIMDVETVTFNPTLLKPPFPLEVVDELRNKYSKFRTRHDPEYIAKVEAKELAKKARDEGQVLSAVQELNRRARQERKALGKPQLSDAVLEHIGRVMAQNRPDLLSNLSLPLPPTKEAMI